MACSACPRALNGWFRGCLAATLTLDTMLFATIARSNRSVEEFVSATFFMVLLVMPLTLCLTCMLTGLPAGFVVWLGESLRIRSALFYAAAGAAIGALIWTLIFRLIGPLGFVFAVAGGLAGIVYWFVAGRFAGQEGQWWR